MIDKDMMVLQNYTNSENIVVGPYGETYTACYDGNQVVNVKAEEGSDAEEEGDPVPITFPEVKAEPEVRFMSLYVACLADNTDMQKCQLSFCSLISFCAHDNFIVLLTGF
jgi:hypothetical protein